MPYAHTYRKFYYTGENPYGPHVICMEIHRNKLQLVEMNSFEISCRLQVVGIFLFYRGFGRVTTVNESQFPDGPAFFLLLLRNKVSTKKEVKNETHMRFQRNLLQTRKKLLPIFGMIASKILTKTQLTQCKYIGSDNMLPKLGSELLLKNDFKFLRIPT